MQMVPSQKETHLPFRDIIAIDPQDKTKNTYGWVGMFPSGWNGKHRLVSYCDAITLEFDDRWMSWIIKTMCKFSGRSLKSIEIIPCDLGPSPDNIKDNVPGDFPSLIDASILICLFSHNRSSADLSSAQFVMDHYHLKKEFGR